MDKKKPEQIKLKQNQHFRAHQDKIVTFFRRGYNVVVGDNAQFVNQTVHEGRWERKVIERIKNVQCPEAVWHRRAALQIDHYLLPFINQCIQNNHSIRREAFRNCPFTSMSFPFRLWIAPMGKIGSRAIYFIYNCKKQAGCTGTQWHVLSGFPSVDGSPLLCFNTVDSAALTHSAVLIKPFHNTNAYLLVGLTVIICQMRRYQKALKLPISLSLKFRFKMQLTSDLNRKQKNDRLDNITFFSQNLIYIFRFWMVTKESCPIKQAPVLIGETPDPVPSGSVTNEARMQSHRWRFRKYHHTTKSWERVAISLISVFETGSETDVRKKKQWWHFR